MDSNFQVKVTADISALQASLKNVQADLDKFKKSADGAAAATKNMEANANRGRMVAFAFGQVVRDAGFFANSFSLGILAISNNIPILIDQLALSIPALSGMAGALSLLGSLLTAGLTIWAYSSQSVNQNKKSLDEWRNSLDDVTESTLKGTQASTQEIAKLDLLYKASINTANSTQTRISAAKQLQDLYPSVFQNYSTEEIMLGKVQTGYNKLRDSILEAALAQARFDKIVENSNKILDNNARSKEIQAELNNIASATTKTLTDQVNTINSTYSSNQKAFRTTATQLASLISKTLESSESYQTLKAELQSLNADTKKLNEQNKDLERTTNSNKKSVDALIGSWSGYSKGLNTAKDTAQQVSKALSVGVVNTAGDLTAPSVLISDEDLAREQQRIENINKQSRAYEALSISTQNANQWVQHLAQTVGGELVNSFNEMLTTGTFSFESIGKALLDMIKRLAAAAMAAAVLSAILSSLFPGAGNTSFKDVFGQIIGMRFAGGVGATSAPSIGSMTTNGINTSINTANSSSGGNVLETRVSGNDLVILLDRASNNRNKYF
jgi:hypothetical protein